MCNIAEDRRYRLIEAAIIKLFISSAVWIIMVSIIIIFPPHYYIKLIMGLMSIYPAMGIYDLIKAFYI